MILLPENNDVRSKQCGFVKKIYLYYKDTFVDRLDIFEWSLEVLLNYCYKFGFDIFFYAIYVFLPER